MTGRPASTPRAVWFARRRNRRVNPDHLTVARLDKHASKLARVTAHVANQPNPAFAVFYDAGRRGIEPHYVPPLVEVRT